MLGNAAALPRSSLPLLWQTPSSRAPREALGRGHLLPKKGPTSDCGSGIKLSFPSLLHAAQIEWKESREGKPLKGERREEQRNDEWQQPAGGFSSYQTDLSDAPNEFDNVQSLFAINFNARGFSVRSIISSHRIWASASSHLISSTPQFSQAQSHPNTT